MSQTAPVVASAEGVAPKMTAKQTVKPKKAASKAAKKPQPDHPKFADMISEAIIKLNDGRKGSSRQAIHKYITTTFGIEPAHAKQYINRELVKGVQSKHLTKVGHGVGANGSFKLSKKDSHHSSDDEKPTRKVAKRAASDSSPAAAAVAKKPRTVSDAKKKVTAAAATKGKRAAAAKHEK